MMIKAFTTGINLTLEGKIAPKQQPVRIAFQDIILAEVEGDQLISFCASSARHTGIISLVDDEGRDVRIEGSEYGEVMLAASNLWILTADFVSKAGIDAIRIDVQAGFLGQLTSGQAQEMGCGSLDMLIRGVPSILAQASCAMTPLKFFEALERAVNFYPGLMTEIMPHVSEIAGMAFRGEKGLKLADDDNFWVDHCKFKLMKPLMVEVVVQKLNEGHTNFLDSWLSTERSKSEEMSHFLNLVFHHPAASTIEAAELPHAVLRKVNEMEVQLKVSPVHAARALGDNFKPLAGYIQQGYDWREIRLLGNFTGDPYERLAGYLKSNLGAFSQLDPKSSVFWAVVGQFDVRTLAPLFHAIAAQDPAGFGQAFDHLSHKDQMACLALGYVDTTWVDLQTLPQAGLSRMLETDLGL